jgi:hypothetical protein
VRVLNGVCVDCEASRLGLMGDQLLELHQGPVEYCGGA